VVWLVSVQLVENDIDGLLNMCYIVAYARIVTDKNDNIILHGVYFGGIENTMEEAEQIARECVNTIRGGIILPRVIKLEDNLSIVDALYDAEDKFERIVKNMVESNEIMNRNKQNKM
jgi:3-deoxy-D-arabino-heptulosonate 7-phosphate (DAHP) synthase